MKKPLTTVQQRKNSIIRKRIIIIISLVIIIPVLYFCFSNYIKGFLYELNSDISISSIKTSKSNKNNICNNTDENTKQNDAETLETSIFNNDKISNNNSSNVTSGTSIDDDLDSYSFIYKKYDEIFSSSNTQNTTNTYTPSDEELKEHFNSNHSSSTASDEINYNNQQIENLKKQQEELESIKENYNSTVNEIEIWYNEEFNKNYDLMIEAKNNYQELGGYATQEDKVNALKKLKSADQELINMGLANSGYAINYKKTLQDEYETVCKRYAYSQEYDKYYTYIYTTLISEKNSKLSVAVQEYNETLQNYKNKYGL